MTTPTRTDRWLDSGGSYEYRVVSFAPRTSTGTTRQMLAKEAEQGRWELARTAMYWGGGKRVWLRRKTLTIESTLYGDFD